MDAQQRPDIGEVLCSSWVVDQGLDLETDQPFDTDDADSTKFRIATDSAGEQTLGDGTRCIEQIGALVCALIVTYLVAPEQRDVAKSDEQRIGAIRVGSIDEQVDILGRSHDLVHDHGQSTDERPGDAFVLEGIDQLSDLAIEARDVGTPRYIFRRYSPPTSYRAWLICPSELYFTASIRRSKMFLRSRAACCRAGSAAASVASALRSCW